MEESRFSSPHGYINYSHLKVVLYINFHCPRPLLIFKDNRSLSTSRLLLKISWRHRSFYAVFQRFVTSFEEDHKRQALEAVKEVEHDCIHEQGQFRKGLKLLTKDVIDCNLRRHWLLQDQCCFV